MRLKQFGIRNNKTVVLIHPSLVMWDYFENVIPLLEKDYHLVIPVLPGYDPKQKSDFSSVEGIAGQLENQLLEEGINELDCIYGCSMGGSIALRFLADRKIPVKSAVIDGGITPYQLPWIITRLIALKDFLMICMGKFGGIRLLEKAFSTDEYSKEDLEYVAKVLKMISYRTIWNTFDSCNNYDLPDPFETDTRKIEYWYADKEAEERKWDIAYVKERIPQTVFREFEDIGHAGMALLRPEEMAERLKGMIKKEEKDVTF
jgi:pimeloyl-ACP methyl ester carboxylesterase